MLYHGGQSIGSSFLVSPVPKSALKKQYDYTFHGGDIKQLTASLHTLAIKNNITRPSVVVCISHR